jgi:hypothetical protein
VVLSGELEGVKVAMDQACCIHFRILLAHVVNRQPARIYGALARMNGRHPAIYLAGRRQLPHDCNHLPQAARR